VLLALARVLKRAEMFASHEIQREPLSVRDRMGEVLSRVNQEFVSFHLLFRVEEGRMGVVVTFLAIMELVRESLLEFVQNEPFAPIHVRAAQGAVDRAAPVFTTQYGGESDTADDADVADDQQTAELAADPPADSESGENESGRNKEE